MAPKNIFLFAFVSFLMASSITLFISYIDPMKNIALFKNKYGSHHLNLVHEKLKMMNDTSFDNKLIIIGSSTSETYLPKFFSEKFNLNAFSASIGGADSSIKYAFAKKALEKTSVKNVVVVADFFEVVMNSSDVKLLNSPFIKIDNSFYNFSIQDIIKVYFSHQSLESALNVIKRHKKNKSIILNADGTTQKSMLLVDDVKDLAELKTNITENIFTYKNIIFKDKDKIESFYINQYRDLAKSFNESNKKLFIIISPYHKIFLNRLMENVSIKKLYSDWVCFLTSLESENVKIIQSQNKFDCFTQEDKICFRDGLHYNLEITQEITNIIPIISK